MHYYLPICNNMLHVALNLTRSLQTNPKTSNDNKQQYLNAKQDFSTMDRGRAAEPTASVINIMLYLVQSNGFYVSTITARINNINTKI